MFSQDSRSCFEEHPEEETNQARLCLPSLVEIVERLLDGLTKLRLQPAWIEREEVLVKSRNCVRVMDHIWSAAGEREAFIAEKLLSEGQPQA